MPGSRSDQTGLAVKLALHYLQKKKPGPQGGSILCTASNTGLYPFPAAPLYATSKAGVIGLVRALGRPLQKVGIQINALAPAVIGTSVVSDLLVSAG